MEVVCDECGFTFDVSVQQERRQDVTKSYFTCPMCGHEYLVGYSNNEMEEIQLDLKTMYKALLHVGDFDKRAELWKMIKQSEDMIKSLSDDLIEEHESSW